VRRSLKKRFNRPNQSILLIFLPKTERGQKTKPATAGRIKKARPNCPKKQAKHRETEVYLKSLLVQ